MSLIIGRFEVPVDDKWHEVDHFGTVLAVNAVGLDVVEFWATTDPMHTFPRIPTHHYRVFGTGQGLVPGPLGDGETGWRGTCIAESYPDAPRLVWHLVESMP